MELEDVQSDLNALRKLYGLLQNKGDGLQNASAENLDGKAQLLLKNLLDRATENIFEAHSKIIATQLHIPKAPCSTSQEKLRDTAKPQPPVSANIFRTSQGVTRNSAKSPNYHAITSQRDEWAPTKPATPRAIFSEMSKFSTSSTDAENRTKRFRVCQQSSVCQLVSAEEPNKVRNPNNNISVQHQQHDQSSRFCYTDQGKGLRLEKKSLELLSSIENQRQKRIGEIQSNLSGNESSSCSLGIPATGAVKSGAILGFAGDIKQKPVDANSVSKEVSDMIKHIESRITSLQLVAENVGASEKNAAQHGLQEMMANSIPGTESVTPVMETKLGLVTRSELSQAGMFVLGRNDSPSQQASRRVREPKGSSWAHQMPSQPSETKLRNKTTSQTAKLLRPSNNSLSRLARGKVSRSEGITLVDDMLSQVGNTIARHKLPSYKANRVPGQNVTAIVEKTESLSQVSSQNDYTPSQTNKFVRGFRVKSGQKEIVNGAPPFLARIPSQTNKENWDQNQKTQKVTSKVKTSQPSMPSGSVGFIDYVGSNEKIQDSSHKLSRTWTKGKTLKEKVLPHQAIMRPTLLDHKPSQIRLSPTLYKDRMGQERSGGQRISHVGPRRKIFRHQQKLEDSSSSSHSSSIWTSQQASTSGSESGGSSLPSRTRHQHYMGHTTSSESEVYSVASEFRDHQVDPTSSNESESDKYSSPDRVWAHHRMDLTSQPLGSTSRRMRMGPSKNYRSGNLANPKKQIRWFRKLKDKLAIIFHHHHHHHHHHHNNDDSHSDHCTKASRATSLWKHAGKIFHKTSKDEAYGEQAAEKLAKSMVRNVPDKNQHRHFHSLVEGLLKHVRHSKKSKQSKAGIDMRQSVKGQHGSKKVAKKLHWWQKFHRHRRTKMPNKPRVKLGFGSKKPKLPALPKMR